MPAILHEELSGTSSSPGDSSIWSNFGSQQGLKEGREIIHQEVPKAIFTLSGYTPTHVVFVGLVHEPILSWFADKSKEQLIILNGNTLI